MDTNYLSIDEVEFYRKNGYLVVKNVFEEVDILRFRKKFDQAFSIEPEDRSPFDSEGILNGVYDMFPDMVTALFTPKYFGIIKDLLGKDVTFLPEPSVHRNRFFHWHKDTTSQEKDGVKFHHSAQNILLQVAIYFQRNGPCGGGLTLIPGSQFGKDRFVEMYYSGYWGRWKNRLLKLLGLSVFQRLDRHPYCIDIMTEPGDLLVFDLRLDHRSTFPKSKDNCDQDKYAIFNTFGRAEQYTKEYQNYLRSRPEPYYQWLRNSTLHKDLLDVATQNEVSVFY